LHVDVLLPTCGRGQAWRDARDSALAVARRDGERLGIPIDLSVIVVSEADGSARGPAYARNLAVLRGRGEFLALLDDDDRWLPGRLAETIPRLRDGCVLACGDAETGGDGHFLDGGRGGTSHRDLVLDCFVAASTATLRRADWPRMDESMRHAEDYDAWLRLSQRGGIHVARLPLARLGRGGASTDAFAMADSTLRALRSANSVPRSRRAALLASRALASRAGRRLGAVRDAAESVILSPSSGHSFAALRRVLTPG
jgi:glycosyltransferase involved in cell wall biosynthesis